jgi:hypothetical protein
MHWLDLLGLFAGRLFQRDGSHQDMSFLAIFDTLVIKSRKLTLLTMIGIGVVIFFCSGLLVAIFNATSEFDRKGDLQWTATMIAGLVMAGIALAGFLYVFMFAWPHTKKSKAAQSEASKKTQAGPSSSLEAAIALLVMDIVKERERKRAHREAEYQARHHYQESATQEGTA